MWVRRTVLCAAVLLVFAACTSTADTTSTTAATTTTAVTATTSSTPTTTTAVSTTTPTATTTTTVVGSPLGPPGWDTWTLIYASLDATVHSRSQAETIAATVDRGAVLLSDDYPSLNSGFWVVYAGAWGDRGAAGNWCPSPLDPSLSCYPRYLGLRATDLVEAGAAIAQLGERLVVLDPATGNVFANLSDNFHNEGQFPNRFNLNLREAELYFGLWVEDSWFSCESSQGEVLRLDLDSGTEELFADGWAPSISPDGRWLALVAAAECFPDPEEGQFVVAPGSQVEVYDLAMDAFSPAFLFRPRTAPTSYEDEQQVLDVYWEADGESLLVALGDGTVRSVALTRGVVLDEAPVAFELGEPYLDTVSPDHLYFTSATGNESILVTRVDRVTGDVVSTTEFDGYWADIAVNPNGEVLIGSSGLLILPSGEQIPIDGDVSNLAW